MHTLAHVGVNLRIHALATKATQRQGQGLTMVAIVAFILACMLFNCRQGCRDISQYSHTHIHSLSRTRVNMHARVGKDTVIRSTPQPHRHAYPLSQDSKTHARPRARRQEDTVILSTPRPRKRTQTTTFKLVRSLARVGMKSCVATLDSMDTLSTHTHTHGQCNFNNTVYR